MTERRGIPLVSLQTAAKVDEGTILLDAGDASPPIKRRRRRPATMDADQAYQGRARRDGLRRRHITPRIARPGVDAGTKLGRHRWVVEMTQPHYP